jgi:MoaA/NifB/PqqE/SkfB family radical SAM enzyme
MLRDPAIPLGQQLQHGPRCMGDVAVRIEPDGAVIPASGAHQSAGNLLRDPWQRIWQHPAFRIYRERVPRPTDESGLPDLTSGAADERSA